MQIRSYSNQTAKNRKNRPRGVKLESVKAFDIKANN